MRAGDASCHRTGTWYMGERAINVSARFGAARGADLGLRLLLLIRRKCMPTAGGKVSWARRWQGDAMRHLVSVPVWNAGGQKILPPVRKACVVWKTDYPRSHLRNLGRKLFIRRDR
ncbi:hypothetical protein KCP74_19815 [Salmonella enterica subsp. enterica]|nr:hypothetical protein KCP74_19815 [Salmonella enterica subsp. enterica]